MQNFVLFICSKEKVKSSELMHKNKLRLQKIYENKLRSLIEKANTETTRFPLSHLNFVTKAPIIMSPNEGSPEQKMSSDQVKDIYAGRHVSHYYTMLAHGIDA